MQLQWCLAMSEHNPCLDRVGTYVGQLQCHQLPTAPHCSHFHATQYTGMTEPYMHCKISRETPQLLLRADCHVRPVLVVEVTTFVDHLSTLPKSLLSNPLQRSSRALSKTSVSCAHSACLPVCMTVLSLFSCRDDFTALLKGGQLCDTQSIKVSRGRVNSCGGKKWKVRKQ